MFTRTRKTEGPCVQAEAEEKKQWVIREYNLRRLSSRSPRRVYGEDTSSVRALWVRGQEVTTSSFAYFQRLRLKLGGWIIHPETDLLQLIENKLLFSHEAECSLTSNASCSTFVPQVTAEPLFSSGFFFFQYYILHGGRDTRGNEQLLGCNVCVWGVRLPTCSDDICHKTHRQCQLPDNWTGRKACLYVHLLHPEYIKLKW